MKENYEIKLISIGIIFSIVGTIIKLVEVGQSWPYIIMWMGCFMLSIGMVSLVLKYFNGKKTTKKNACLAAIVSSQSHLNEQ